MQRMTDEKRERRNKIVLSIVIALLMVLSTFGFVLDYAGGGSGQSEKAQSDYGPLTFKLSGQAVVTEVKGQTLQFGFFPSQLDGINVSAGIREALHQPAFYITSDPSDPYASAIDEMALRYSEMMPVLTQGYPLPAFTNATDYARPGITCANASVSVPVLYFKYGNDTAIRYEGGCIIAEARTPTDVLALADRLLYTTMGVASGP